MVPVSALRGLAVGVLGLTALDVLVSKQGSKNVGGLFVWVSAVFNHWLSPTIALIPDLRAAANVPMVPFQVAPDVFIPATGAPASTPSTMSA